MFTYKTLDTLPVKEKLIDELWYSILGDNNCIVAYINKPNIHIDEDNDLLTIDIYPIVVYSNKNAIYIGDIKDKDSYKTITIKNVKSVSRYYSGGNDTILYFGVSFDYDYNRNIKAIKYIVSENRQLINILVATINIDTKEITFEQSIHEKISNISEILFSDINVGFDITTISYPDTIYSDQSFSLVLELKSPSLVSNINIDIIDSVGVSYLDHYEKIDDTTYMVYLNNVYKDVSNLLSAKIKITVTNIYNVSKTTFYNVNIGVLPLDITYSLSSNILQPDDNIIVTVSSSNYNISDISVNLSSDDTYLTFNRTSDNTIEITTTNYEDRTDTITLYAYYPDLNLSYTTTFSIIIENASLILYNNTSDLGVTDDYFDFSTDYDSSIYVG